MEQGANSSVAISQAPLMLPGTLISILGALFKHHLQILHLFSCEDSGSERLKSGPWLHSFQRAQRCIERPLEKGLQIPSKGSIGHKLSLAFPAPYHLQGLRYAIPMMISSLLDAHRGTLLGMV